MAEPTPPFPRSGWIEVIVGSMYSGKTEELIRRLRRAQIARQRVQIFKPRLDDRYSEDQIVSHSEMKIRSQLVLKAGEIIDAIRVPRPRDHLEHQLDEWLQKVGES